MSASRREREKKRVCVIPGEEPFGGSPFSLITAENIVSVLTFVPLIPSPFNCTVQPKKQSNKINLYQKRDKREND
jgi:hypothetical protein